MQLADFNILLASIINKRQYIDDIVLQTDASACDRSTSGLYLEVLHIGETHQIIELGLHLLVVKIPQVFGQCW